MFSATQVSPKLNSETGLFSLTTAELAAALSHDEKSARQMENMLTKREGVDYFWNAYNLQPKSPLVPEGPLALDDQGFEGGEAPSKVDRLKLKGNQDRMCAGVYFPSGEDMVVQVWGRDLHIFTELKQVNTGDTWGVKRIIARADCLTDHFYASAMWLEAVADFEHNNSTFRPVMAIDEVTGVIDRIRPASGEVFEARNVDLSIDMLHQLAGEHEGISLSERSRIMLSALHSLINSEYCVLSGPGREKVMSSFSTATSAMFSTIRKESEGNADFDERIAGKLLEGAGKGDDMRKVVKAASDNRKLENIKRDTAALFKRHRQMGALRVLGAT